MKYYYYYYYYMIYIAPISRIESEALEVSSVLRLNIAILNLGVNLKWMC